MTSFRATIKSKDELPTIKEQFLEDCFKPTTVQLAKYNASQEICFETAKENYEISHGHQLPFKLRSFQRFLHEGIQRERGKY